LAVPGVIAREGRHGRYLTVAGRAGLVVPIQSVDGLVVGLVLRPDDPGEGGKYRWLSSAGKGGPAAKSRVHVPAGVGPSKRVVVVEGSLKSNAVAALSRRAAIGLPGCHVTDDAIAVLQSLGARQPLLALDADAPQNHHVARAQVEGLKRLRAAGFDALVVRWPLAAGKGFDDFLLARRDRRAGR
jgi:hypothetical protein